MSTDQNLEVFIKADSSGVKTGMDESAQAVTSTTSKISQALQNMASESAAAVNKLTAGMQSFAAMSATSSTQVTAAMTGVASEIRQLASQFDSASSNMAKYAESNRELMERMVGMREEAKRNTSTFGELGGVIRGLALFEAAKQAVGTMASFEQLQISLNSVMGSAEKGAEAFAWVKQFTVDTPFQVNELAQSFRMLKAYGLDPTNGSLKAIADMAAYTGRGAEGLHSAVLGLGQAWTRAKLQGQDILQLINVGVPVWDILAQATGKNTKEVMELSEKGQLGRDAILALMDGMEKLSGGAAQAQMDSLSGKFSNLQDSIANTLDEMRRAGALDPLKELVEGATNSISSIKAVFMELQTTLGALGKVATDTWNNFTSVVADSTGQQITAMSVLRGALEVLRDLLIGLRLSLQMFGEFAQMTFETLKGSALTFAESANKALHLDFSGAREAWNRGMTQIQSDVQKHFDNMVESARKAQEDILKFSAFYPDQGGGSKVDTSSGAMTTKTGNSLIEGSDKKGKGHGDAVVKKYEAELAEKKAAYQQEQLMEGSFREYSKEQELAFWTDKLSKVKAGTKEESELKLKVNQLKLAMDKEAFAAEIEQIKSEADEFRNNAQKKLEVAQAIAAKIQAAYGAQSQQYIQAQRAVVQAEQAVAQQRTQIEDQLAAVSKARALAEIQSEQDASNTRRQLGIQTAAQTLELERKFAQERLAVERKFLQDQLAVTDPQKDPLKVSKLNAELEQLEIKHQTQMAQIDNRLSVERANAWKQVDSALTNSMQQNMMGILQRTTTVTGALKNMFWDAANAIGQAATKMAADWVMAQIRMKVASKETALTTINNDALAAASGAYKALVGIPIVGPVLAPAAAAVAYAGVMAFGAMASAEGGYDIPSGTNPVTQLHQKEMVLPAQYANVIRDLGAMHLNSGGIGRASDGPPVQFNGTPLAGGFFIAHQDEFVRFYKTIQRRRYI